MKKILLSYCFLLLAMVLSGHEFWLQPGKYFYNIREIADISFRVGENFTGENWSGNRDKIKMLTHILPNGTSVDLSGRISLTKGDSLKLPLQQEGTHMILFNSTNSFIDLEPEKFKAYLEEDGLMDAIIYRSKNGESLKNGKEYYQRSVKTIIQVGNERTDACTKPTALPLDIIPIENPYTPPGLRPTQDLPSVRFRILFKGKPLANHLVKTWFRNESGQTTMETYKTNSRGLISAKRHSGKFMVSTVYMERNNADTIADWQSYWASVNFEYSSFFPVNR
jgi:uncharacterized GH25 family protein